MKRLFAAALGLAVLGLAGSAGAQEKKDDKKDDKAAKLVGKWELAKGGDLPPGSTLEFAKDGKFGISFKADDKEVKVEGTYKLDGDKLAFKFKFDGKDHDETATVKKLTDDALHVEDKDGQLTEFKKAKK